jgi:taurine dioxygenase
MAYEAMPDDLKRRITGLKATFRYGGRSELSRGHLSAEDKAAAAVTHPVVRVHPETGRPAVYVNPYHALRIVGMPEDESDALLDEIFAWCDRPEFQWRHRWQVGDTIVWENRAAWHSATMDYPRDQARIFMRATVRGTDTTAEAQIDRLAG